MPVSASKLVTLAQLQAQAERVKQELAKYTLASELGSLAKKSEISEADLSAALKSVIDGKMDAADSMTTEAINSAIATAIAKSAHARFEKVEKVPSNDEAQDNVLYLVMNAATGYYDIYAKVGEEVVRLDDTTVDLSNYATIDQLNAVSGGIGGTAYAGTKEDLSASDDSVIAAYFKAHTDVAVKKGDVFVVTTTVGNSTYEKSAYFYNGKAWVAMTGNVDADKVILRENITLAGGYTQVGNLTKSQNGTATFATKGKSVMDALTEIFSKRLQPSITAQPSIGTFTLTGAGAVEAGTKVAAAAYSGATLNAGSYQYGPATGVTATNWKVERITNAATTQVTTADAASLTAGSDNNGGAGFIIGDAGDNAVSSLKYRVTATHGAGVTAKDNLGADSSPVVAIAAGSKTKDTAAYTPFRNVFYGTSADKPALDSAAIRALGKTGKAYAAGTLTINVPVGAQRVAIACIATAKGVTKVINETAMNADVTSTFTKSTVSVEGANGYAAKDYNVWVFEPAVALWQCRSPQGYAGLRGEELNMAVNNTAKAYSNMEFPLSMKRQDAFALDPTCVWPSLAEAQNYAKTNPTAYIGQVLSVVADGTATAYTIKNAAGDLAPLGDAAVDIATDSEVSEMLSEVFPADNT